ncbi:MAG: substrate-binding domain-containing protein, partial [Pseudomonadota bacterium]
MKIFPLAVGLAAALLSGAAEARGLIVQSTTSTANSGLYDHLLPLFEAATGIRAQVVAVGTGQALRNARNCDGDVVLVHARAAEEAFVAAGHGLERRAVMYNDFVVVGPLRDPAKLDAAESAADAFDRIALSGEPFVSRGDDSGTHRKELRVWASAGRSPEAESARWYRETGSGMGATLNIAAGMGAYALTDRATWTAFANKGGLRILFQG